jgi:integrase
MIYGTVPPARVKNAKRRPRKYLTVEEIIELMDGARERGRYGHPDATMILVGYRHGLRVSELCTLPWDQVDFERGLLHVRRVKSGTPSVHPVGGIELRSLRASRLMMSFQLEADLIDALRQSKHAPFLKGHRALPASGLFLADSIHCSA